MADSAVWKVAIWNSAGEIVRSDTYSTETEAHAEYKKLLADPPWTLGDGALLQKREAGQMDFHHVDESMWSEF